MSHEQHECDELKHDPWPGFRLAFGIVFAIFASYLLFILVTSPWGKVGHH